MPPAQDALSGKTVVAAAPGIIDTLARAIAELNAEPDIIERQTKIGWIPFSATPQELLAQMRAEVESYRGWVQRTGFKID